MTRPPAATPPPDGGFTLLELLVALLVLGLVLASLVGGTRFGIRAADTQNRTGTAIAELDGVDRILRRLLDAADPGTEREPAPFAGTAATLVFAAPLPPGAVPPGFTRDATAALGLDGAGRLLLRFTPFRHARPLSPPPEPVTSVLLHGAAGIELAYWDGTAWRSTWSEPVLPELVRLRIRFPPGDARAWPDLVMAPKRGSARM